MRSWKKELFGTILVLATTAFLPLGITDNWTLSSSLPYNVSNVIKSNRTYTHVNAVDALPSVRVKIGTTTTTPTRTNVVNRGGRESDTDNQSYPSCAHVGNALTSSKVWGPKGNDETMFWLDSMGALDRNCEENTIEMPMHDSKCPMAIVFKMLAWYMHQLQKYDLSFFFIHANLIGALREAGSVVCHSTDIEIFVLIRSLEDKEKMQQIKQNAIATEYILLFHYGGSGWHLSNAVNNMHIDCVLLERKVPNSLIWVGSKKGSQAKKDAAIEMDEDVILPLRQCSFHGMVVPCAGGCGYFCSKKKVVDIGLWFPERVQTQNLGVGNRSALAENQRTNKFFDGWGAKPKCARNQWILRDVYNAYLKPRLLYIGKSMACLYDHGFASYLDGWGEMTITQRSDILNGGYDQSLPINTSDPSLGLLPRKFAIAPLPRLGISPSSWPAYVGINSDNSAVFDRIRDHLFNMKGFLSDGKVKEITKQNSGFQDRYIGWNS